MLKIVYSDSEGSLSHLHNRGIQGELLPSSAKRLYVNFDVATRKSQFYALGCHNIKLCHAYFMRTVLPGLTSFLVYVIFKLD